MSPMILIYSLVANGMFFLLSRFFLNDERSLYLSSRTQFSLWVLSSSLVALCFLSTEFGAAFETSLVDELLGAGVVLVPPLFFSLNIFAFSLSFFKQRVPRNDKAMQH